ncbi:MAG TPA: hypothetical protein VIX41_03575 [Acidimicrobiales bacterium]
MSAEEGASALARLLVGLMDLFDPVSDAVIGYRNKLVDKGLGKAAADQCAADFHGYLLHMMPQGKSGQGSKS